MVIIINLKCHLDEDRFPSETALKLPSSCCLKKVFFAIFFMTLFIPVKQTVISISIAKSSIDI